ncbi:two component transcriptional regulator, LuxR family [Frankia torreyi]|uniref:Two component transcriptional regulator, LuxR family n=1 Tax=Frankia torreyi TaxID=1856 RepID=A0A0D8BJB7_9ACTN|nr:MULTISPECIES: response regulator transcription factor [Frankia]KJE23502.1 two component transcriptional regulator, LuxR family [Frankia torreyi]KQC39852.1 LuxR family transcriptional regulator [Frankia sp. ACN1ag]KQM05496.1 two component transcriptional regulator, LuxR family [Frankia sp. CpI1-P]
MTTEATPAIRVLLADDQALVRGGFRMILDARPGIEVVGEAGDGAEAVELVGGSTPDVVLMDVRMPTMDGVEATRRIAASGSAARVIILTTYDLDEYVFAALRAGASGFMLKDVRPAELVDAVRVVARGDALLAPTVTRRLLDRFAQTLPSVADAPSPDGPAGRRRAGAGSLDRPVRAVSPPEVGGEAGRGARIRIGLEELTEREAVVLRLVALALSNAEIAAELVLTEATVKTHVSAVLRKLGLRDRVQAVVFAYDHGLVRPRPN